ncbi:hypothetical protein RMSM_00431 [Rhodopirellula maiorica SM1]|uniref:Uncharacterized protein n=1 Tax=Rhodopirellula maiorica SM1 TaxID=1265738 RepID=M5S901_9BACT|nr:hypothetical protein RMSM_00431 [Rhodopirellula maiorica SM1]
MLAALANAVKHFSLQGKREFTLAKVAEIFGHAGKAETLCEFRYEKMLHSDAL